MNTNVFSTAKAFRLIGTFAFILAIVSVLTSILTYLPIDPDFSIFTTYLSDIGDTPVWPQVILNTGAILVAPVRYAVIALLGLRLRSFSTNKKSFEVAVLTIGAMSTIGTVLMTAVPFSTAPAVHKSGIGLYFLGVVFLQMVIGVKEASTKGLPRILPVLSFTVVASFILFLILFILYQMGYVGRTTPVFWEWMCFFTSTGWLVGHSIILGNENIGKSEI